MSSMVCHELMHGASMKQEYLDCPIRVFPKCHKKAHVEVFVDGKRRKIMLCCSACDRPISLIELGKKRKKKQ